MYTLSLHEGVPIGAFSFKQVAPKENKLARQARDTHRKSRVGKKK
eukprot:COSAG06_NODE_67840_length_251_cov_0.473684_1_plen_44_part_10